MHHLLTCNLSLYTTRGQELYCKVTHMGQTPVHATLDSGYFVKQHNQSDRPELV